MLIFFRNIADCFKGWNLIWQGIMIFITYGIVVSGLDWWYFQTFGVNDIRVLIFPALIGGSLLPILVPIVFFVKKKTSLAWALGQSAIIGSILSSTYKLFTGRIPPTLGSNVIDISNGFRFGLYQGGIFWGWPSSHTTIAFSMAVALITIYPKNLLLKILALSYALYVGLAVSVSIHWLSEFVAGAILGSVIGTVVGRNFVNKKKIILNNTIVDSNMTS